LLGATLPLQAAVIVSLEDEPPAASKILSTFSGPSTGNIAWHQSSSTSYRSVAFAFQIKDAGLLNEIGVYLANSKGGANMNFSLTLRKSTSVPTSANPLTEGTLVGNFTGQIDVAQTAGILKFDLGENLSVAAGEYYTVILNWTGTADANKHFNILYGDDSSAVSAGSWDATNGGSWVRRDSRDYLFYAATQIPEPSTVVLLGLPAFALGLHRWRKSRAPRL